MLGPGCSCPPRHANCCSRCWGDARRGSHGRAHPGHCAEALEGSWKQLDERAQQALPELSQAEPSPGSAPVATTTERIYDNREGGLAGACPHLTRVSTFSWGE